MLRIKKIKNNTVDYECECGVVGRCMIKPMSKKLTIVMDISCAGCGETKRITMKQVEFEEGDNLSWALTLSNEILMKNKNNI